MVCGVCVILIILSNANSLRISLGGAYTELTVCLIITGNTNWARKQINLKLCLSMEEVIFDKNADTTVSMNTAL